ncbi:DUF115 domain-containing protein [Candidatus Parcubacteria bacterium]|nr:MAG: DUF115 domain-containing protein [Candidatus Parcubacteria bacterium]
MKKTKIDLEQAWKKIFLEHETPASFNVWVKNFALNLNKIWEESSARELDPSITNQRVKKNIAVVIGRGPSLKKYNHLEMLAKSSIDATIVCSDGALISALKAGVTPDKFQNFFVATIDPREDTRKFYDDKIVDSFGHKIKGIFATVSNPDTVERARLAGIKPYWIHTLVDYNEGKKSFNNISAIMTRARKHVDGLPAIQTGGNVGTSAWFISWQILKCQNVVLLGINHGWEEDDPLDKIMTHNYTNKLLDIDKKSVTFRKLFPKVYNPHFDCHVILDPIFQYYSSAFKEFIERAPSWVKTVNATEGGAIFGNRIDCIRFGEFLKQHTDNS